MREGFFGNHMSEIVRPTPDFWIQLLDEVFSCCICVEFDGLSDFIQERFYVLIKPSKKNVKSFLDEIRKTIKFNANTATENLIQQLNPKIRGWANYFRHVVAKETFSHVDACIFKAILRWIKKRHPKKNAKWTNRKYFRPEGFRNWIFFVRVIDVKNKDTYLDLHSAAYTPIRRHVKIKSAATPYDPQFKEYFLERQRYRKNIRESGSKEGTANSNVSRNTARATGSV